MKPLYQSFMPQRAINRLAGYLANQQRPWLKDALIRYFVNRYPVNMAEAQEPNPFAYSSFNDFFSRALQPEARPIATDPHVIVSPVDGCISHVGQGKTSHLAKGHHYTLRALLGGSESEVRPFEEGASFNAYLAPKDYHRVHMPVSGRLKMLRYIQGKLFSVNPQTCSSIPGLFARNERLVALFETELGPMAMVLVGAMIVGHIKTPWDADWSPKAAPVTTLQYQSTGPILEKGAEMGRFQLGSTVIVLFSKDTLRWFPELQEGSVLKMGMPVGELL